MNRTAVYLQGALEPILLDEPLEATMMNMSAAMNANLLFFSASDIEGRKTMVSMRNVLFMRDENED